MRACCTVTYETRGGGYSWAYLDVTAADLTAACEEAARRVAADRRRRVARIRTVRAVPTITAKEIAA